MKISTFQSSDPAYNLPFDTIYYIDDNAHYELNEYIYAHREEIEKLLPEMPEMFTYQFRYVSLNKLSDEELTTLVSRQYPTQNEHKIKEVAKAFKEKGLKVKHKQTYHLMARLISFDETAPAEFLTQQITLGSPNAVKMQIVDFVSQVIKANEKLLLDDAYEIFLKNKSKESQKGKRKKARSKEIEEVQRAEDRELLSCVVQDETSCLQSAEKERIALIEKALKIRAAIAEMEQLQGMNILVETLGTELSEVLNLLPKAPISNLVVDEQFRIFLPAYNQEVKLNALAKSLYFLFLLKPEGIRLKEIDQLRPQLLSIYKLVSNRENTEKMEESIHELTQVTSNSINEKLSRIRAAFTKNLVVDIAQYYLPSGPRGEKKIIPLDTDFRLLPSSLKRIAECG